jgi:hypothetical protein
MSLTIGTGGRAVGNAVVNPRVLLCTGFFLPSRGAEVFRLVP